MSGTEQVSETLAIAHTLFIDEGGIRYAYRAFGKSTGTPLLLLHPA